MSPDPSQEPKNWQLSEAELAELMEDQRQIDEELEPASFDRQPDLPATDLPSNTNELLPESGRQPRTDAEIAALWLELGGPLNDDPRIQDEELAALHRGEIPAHWSINGTEKETDADLQVSDERLDALLRGEAMALDAGVPTDNIEYDIPPDDRGIDI
jgi:hypothetical protein